MLYFVCHTHTHNACNKRKSLWNQVSWFSGFLVDGGCCILSKYRIVESDAITFEKGLHSDGLSAKGALHALIELPLAHAGDARSNHAAAPAAPAAASRSAKQTARSNIDDDDNDDNVGDNNDNDNDDNDLNNSSSNNSDKNNNKDSNKLSNKDDKKHRKTRARKSDDASSDVSASATTSTKPTSLTTSSTSTTTSTTISTPTTPTITQQQQQQRRSIDDSAKLSASDVRSIDDGENADVDTDGSGDVLRVHVFCTHLQSSYNPEEGLNSSPFIATNATRLRQLAQLRAFIERQLSRTTHDALLLGDFNVDARPHTFGLEQHERHDAGDASAPLPAHDGSFLVSDQYNEMMDKLESPLYRLVDPLRAASAAAGRHTHPITMGDVHLVNGQVWPRDTVLTSKEDFRSRQCLDYALLLRRVQRQAATRAPVLRPVTAFVERFQVDQPLQHRMSSTESSRVLFESVVIVVIVVVFFCCCCFFVVFLFVFVGRIS